MMDSWEFNKIAAAVLSALLIIFGGKEIITVWQYNKSKEYAAVGYKLPVEVSAAPSGQKESGKKDKGLDFAAVAGLMAASTADAGQSVFKKCSACHTPTNGGKNGVGPNLWNIINREIGTVDGFKYSNPMASVGGNWGYEELAQFLHKPKQWLKGTKMAFAGLKREQDIADVLVYLRSLSDSPVALPAVNAQETQAEENTISEPVDESPSVP